MRGQERQFINQELIQRREEGCDVAALAPQIEKALADYADDDIVRLYDELDALEPEADFPYEEPSTLAEIKALRPDGPRRMDVNFSDEALMDRIFGGWLGRAAGCALGKPVEGWPRARIDDFLEKSQALPLDDYLPYVEGQMSNVMQTCTRGNIEFMDRDDDMDYPILGLLALENKGHDLSARTMANTWLSRMPFFLLYTAERNAYANFVQGYWPPESASHRNPHREWIGAQIRADIFGYVTPGWPEKAAELAYQDASISHVKNGIYGEMFVAAMLSAAFVTDDIEQIIAIGLSEIPAQCRLTEAVKDTLEWCRAKDDWEVVWEQIAEKYGRYSGVHTINNAALVVLGLWYGNQDYEAGIVTAVRGGWDTDCNGATVGSILGLKFGAKHLPEKWVGVLNDRLLSSVRDCNDNVISELAERTLKVARKLEVEPEPTGEVPEPVEGSLVAGRWKLYMGQQDWTLTIADNHTGTFDDGAGTTRIRKLQVDGHKLTFDFDIDKGGWSIELSFDGKVDGDRIEGECTAAGSTFPVEGTRDKA